MSAHPTLASLLNPLRKAIDQNPYHEGRQLRGLIMDIQKDLNERERQYLDQVVAADALAEAAGDLVRGPVRPWKLREAYDEYRAARGDVVVGEAGTTGGADG